MTFVQVTRDERGFAVLRLLNKPVNALTLELMQELLAAIESIEADSAMKGFILTSVPTVEFG